MSGSSRVVRFVLLLGILPVAGAARAGEPELDPVLVLAIGDPGASGPTERRVIEERELRARTSLEGVEALRAEPGVQLARQGGPGEDVALRIRGADPSHTLVLLDGVPINDPFVYGLAQLAALDPGGIDRIELVRGPFSAVDAGAAIGGVVRLRTLRASGDDLLSARLDSGVPYALRLSGTASSGTEHDGAAVFVSATDAGEPPGLSREGDRTRFRPDSRFRNLVGAASATGELLDGTLSLSVRVGMSARQLGINLIEGGPVAAAYLDSARSVDRSLTVASARWASGADGPHAWAVRGGVARLGSTDADPLVDGEGVVLPGLGATQFTGALVRRSSSSVIGTDHAIAVGGGNTLLAGAELASLAGSSEGRLRVVGEGGFPAAEFDLGAEDSRVAAATYVADRFELGLFDAEAGVRLDAEGRYGAALSPRGTAGLRIPGPATRLTASYGEGFRAPSFIELAGTPFSNPELAEERARSVELGVVQPLDALLGATGSLSAAAFRTDTRGLVVLGEEGLVNEATARVQGVELALDVRGRLRGGGSLTLLSSSDGGGEELVGVPPRGGSLRAGFSAGRFDADAYGYAWSSRRATELLDLAGELRDRTPAGSRLDLSGGVWLSEGRPSFRLGARLEDALDTRAEEVGGFPAPGRTLLVSCELVSR